MTRDEAIAEIREKTPQLLADYRALADQLKTVLGIPEEEEGDADKPEMGQDEIAELYEGILEFAEGYDLDSIDMLLQQARDYKIPAAEKERFAQVERLVRDSDWDKLKEILAG